MIDLVQLRTFVAVAQEQHLTRAAERIHVSQSAASAHVRAVEETLKTQLFVRTNRSLELTPSGRLLFQKAQELLNEATVFESFARELRGQAEGTLVVASSGDPSSNQIGDILMELRQNHPLLTLDVRVRPSSSTRQGLKNGEIDIGVVLDKPSDDALMYHELKKMRFCIAGPIAWQQQIEQADWAALAKLPWITPADKTMAYACILDDLFGRRGLELNSVATFENSTMCRAISVAGVGLSLMREDNALLEQQSGKLAISPIASYEFSLFAMHLASRDRDPLISAFIKAARKVWPL